MRASVSIEHAQIQIYYSTPSPFLKSFLSVFRERLLTIDCELIFTQESDTMFTLKTAGEKHETIWNPRSRQFHR